jgi:peptidoglycan hydrolase-like protein with peptidoglycan-binding domain
MGVVAVHKRAGIAKEPGRTKRITEILCAALLSAALSGCEGQTQGDQGPQGSATSMEYEHELSMLQPPSAAYVAKAQRQLAALGYDPGPVDGVLGKQTRIAIKHFQVDAEIEVDGELTPAMSDRLKKRVLEGSRLSGYAAPKRQPGEETGTAPKPVNAAGPAYEVGDTYVYSDGRIETVSRVGPERTLWESAEGSMFTAYRNFILPPISWKSGAARGENQVQPAAGVKWPPATTGEIIFSVGSKTGGGPVDAPKTWSGKWRCAAKGVSPVKALAGQFDAVVIECQRTKPEPGTWKKRTWYYVPEIGHYVRRVDRIHGTGREITVDLVTIRPGGKGWPPAARGGLDWAIQGALDTGDYEKAVEWRSSAVGAMFNIRLTGDVAVYDKATCRRYSIERAGAEQVRLFPAIACKTPAGERWLTPGLDSGAVSPGALHR